MSDALALAADSIGFAAEDIPNVAEEGNDKQGAPKELPKPEPPRATSRASP